MSDGTTKTLNKKGIQYYKNLTNELTSKWCEIFQIMNTIKNTVHIFLVICHWHTNTYSVLIKFTHYNIGNIKLNIKSMLKYFWNVSQWSFFVKWDKLLPVSIWEKNSMHSRGGYWTNGHIVSLGFAPGSTRQIWRLGKWNAGGLVQGVCKSVFQRIWWSSKY